MRYVCAFVLAGLCGTALSAQFDEIIFSKSGALCSIAATSGAKEHCFRTDFEYDSPAWQPHGNLLAVAAGLHDGPGKLLLVDSSGKVIRPIAKSSGFMRPTWSPDGKNLYALRYDLGQSVGHWTDKADKYTTVAVRSRVPFKYIQMVAISPDGTHAALLVDDFKVMLVARVSQSGFDVERTLPNDFTYVAQAAWIDNSRLLFVGRKETQLAELWEVDVLTGMAESRGVAGLAIRDFVALSPDRSMAVVCGSAEDAKETRWGIWHYSLVTSVATQLTNGIEDVAPTWRQ